MDLLNVLMNAQGGNLVGELARRHGLEPQQAGAALEKLVPLLAGGVRRNVSQQGGMEALLGALQRGNHGRYLEDTATLDQPETVTDGNAILGHLLGNRETSREVAGHAAASTGIDAGILKQMLPVVATMVMGALSKQASAGGDLDTQRFSGNAQSSPLGSLLTSFLDANRDGSVVDDVLGMLFRR